MNLRATPSRIAVGVGLVWIATLTGCQGGVNTPGGPVGRAVSLAGDVQPILSQKCATCHAAGGFGSAFGSNLALNSGATFGSTVNQPSDQRPDLLRVKPGDSANSLLYLKVSSNNPPVGATMPLLGERLSSSELALLRDWIDQGALDN